MPDADVLIRSAADPLLAIEHHRGFTHSLLFIPIGGVLAALPFGVRRPWTVLAAILAYASHTLLDAATTYGTQWFWPFSRYRVGLDIISIIDPLFTLFVLAGVIAAWFGRRRIAVIALAFCVAWLGIGFVQRERATSAQKRLASSRGDRLARGEAFPTIGNTLVWRSIYESDGTLHIDRIRVPWLGNATYTVTDTVPLATTDVARFAWFSNGWIARSPSDPTIIGDARYSLRTDRYDPVWGIRVHPKLAWIDRSRERQPEVAQLWNEILGRDAATLVP